MKFGWLVVGFLLGIGGIVLACLTNVDKCPHVKSEALKFAIIGFVVQIVLGIVLGLTMGALFTAAVSSAMGGYGYGYHGF